MCCKYGIYDLYILDFAEDCFADVGAEAFLGDYVELGGAESILQDTAGVDEIEIRLLSGIEIDEDVDVARGGVFAPDSGAEQSQLAHAHCEEGCLQR